MNSHLIFALNNLVKFKWAKRSTLHDLKDFLELAEILHTIEPFVLDLFEKDITEDQFNTLVLEYKHQLRREGENRDRAAVTC